MNIIKLKYLAISIIASILTIYLLFLEKESKIKEHLDTHNTKVTQDYMLIYGYYQNIANLIFKSHINKEDINNLLKNANNSSDEDKNNIREKLYEKLKPTYDTLVSNNLKQLHFHLKNNESFLRFHRPSKFGDDLSDFRSTVKYVNEFKKTIDGFEEGRIYNGFRFVFPLFISNEHIGSVEISFSTLAMSKEFAHKLKLNANFLIKKDIVDDKVFLDEIKNYENSPLKDFYVEKFTVKLLTKRFKQPKGECFSEDVKKQYNQLIKNEDIFSLYSKKTKKIVTIKKIYNPVTKKFVAIFVVKSDGTYVINKNKNFYFISTVLVLLILLVCWFICRANIYKKQIENINKELESKVKEEVEKNRQKDQKIFEQSKMAQMGELISMIAHQWRQPLGAIGSSVVSVQNKLLLGKYDLDDKAQREEFIKYVQTKFKDIAEYTEFLSKTIDDFRGFYKQNKEKEFISLKEIIENTLNIIQSPMENHNIKFYLQFSQAEPLNIYKNELIQVILNILKNSEDNFIDQNLDEKKITIKSYENTDFQIIEIEDNGGGIPQNILLNIFEPYFSTKDEKNGTGLGLYMSKIIVEEHHDGEIKAINTQDGVKFIISLPKGKIS